MSEGQDQASAARVVPLRLKDAGEPRVTEIDGGVFLFWPIGQLRRYMRSPAVTASGRNALQQAFLACAEYLLSELQKPSRNMVLSNGMHRRNALARALELVEMARELAARDAPGWEDR